MLKAGPENGRLEKRTRLSVTGLVLSLLIVVSFLYVLRPFNTAEKTGTCISVSVSILPQPQSLAFSSGVRPCGVVPLDQVLD
jgi:hypothetical protein